MTGQSGPGRYIAVEGCIGAGKSTLAHLLANRMKGELIVEAPHGNPFLERFYGGVSQAALPAQLYFLLHRTQLAEWIKKEDLFPTTRISDFLLERDRVYAECTLAADELQVYDMVRQAVAVEPPVPDLVLFLQTSVRTLLKRIANRGIPMERRITADYLEKVNDAMARFILDYDAAPVLIVNTESIDLANNDEHLDLLLDEMKSVTAGRTYFDPSGLVV
ncbi:MAG: deoxynucleoside kinase [Gammaproteobacteria bacterium]|nr:deoxynucleoside kinase [Gammaproteobacteria bacterium]MCY4166496.1 deoxynucleoside kinase [Gammaproteobacteria bacterium]MCY4341101.1 deoxynucleoside kinase [Gammaproteobacteria bacterium]